MSLINILLGKATTSAQREKAERKFDRNNERLKALAAQREQMRESLSLAMKKIIEDRAQ